MTPVRQVPRAFRALASKINELTAWVTPWQNVKGVNGITVTMSQANVTIGLAPDLGGQPGPNAAIITPGGYPPRLVYSGTSATWATPTAPTVSELVTVMHNSYINQGLIPIIGDFFTVTTTVGSASVTTWVVGGPYVSPGGGFQFTDVNGKYWSFITSYAIPT